LALPGAQQTRQHRYPPVDTKDKLEDIFMKQSPKDMFEKLRDVIQGID